MAIPLSSLIPTPKTCFVHAIPLTTDFAIMLDARAKLGIAEIVFYVPMIAVAQYLAIFRHGRPRMAWCLLLSFSLSENIQLLGIVLGH